MNIFVIPSWHPSDDHPLSGNFVKEQAEALCKAYPAIRIGVSIWGQQDERYLLWAKDPIGNLRKILTCKQSVYKRAVMPNLVEYYDNTYTWSRMLLHGNRNGIIKVNCSNLKRFEADFGPVDLLHGHPSPYAGTIIRKVSQLTGIPYCLTEHNPPILLPDTIGAGGRLKNKYSSPFKEAAATVAISPQSASLLARQGVKNIRLIPDHLDEPLFKPAATSAPAKPFIFLMLAHLSTQKGVDVLLRAIALFFQKMPASDAQFVIAGDGDLTGFKATAKELNIAEKIVWTGETSRSEALQLHQQCNVFVLPSLIDNLPLVLLEALVCGKPVIATRCGGPESIVTPRNGLLVEKNDPEALAQALLQLENNYADYDSGVIRQDFLDRFSSTAVLPLLVALYQEIIANHKAKS